MSYATRCVLVSLATAICGPGLANAATAPALQPGVHVDNGSPALKEYAIPLSQARGGGSAGGSGQLFGSGVQPPSGTPASGPSPVNAATGPGSSSATSARPGPPGSGASARGAVAGRTALSTTSSNRPADGFSSAVDTRGSGTGVVSMIGAAVLVLVLGSLGGGALAARNRRTGATTG